MTKKVGITGIAGGLGEAMAKEFASRGYKIIGLDFNRDALAALKESLKFSSYVVDVTEQTEYQAVLEEILSSEGCPDIWINNAGITDIKPFPKTDQDRFDSVMAVNFHAVVQGTRFWLEHMEAIGSGHIVNMASTAGHVACPYMSAYSASKFAVVGFSDAVAMELDFKKSPVTITIVSPGFVHTDIVNLGAEYGFPEKFKFLLDTPELSAKRIVSGIEKREAFISPNLNGQIVQNLKRISPHLAKFSARLLGAKSWKQALGLEPIDP